VGENNKLKNKYGERYFPCGPRDRVLAKCKVAKRMKPEKGPVVLFLAPKRFTRFGHVMSFRRLSSQCDGRTRVVCYGQRSWQSNNTTAKTPGRRPDGESQWLTPKTGDRPANGSPSGHRLTPKMVVADI
jgi:hypothetical protein